MSGVVCGDQIQMKTVWIDILGWIETHIVYPQTTPDTTVVEKYVSQSVEISTSKTWFWSNLANCSFFNLWLLRPSGVACGVQNSMKIIRIDVHGTIETHSLLPQDTPDYIQAEHYVSESVEISATKPLF